MENQFGRLLRYYRKKAVMSQEALAFELRDLREEPINKSRISKWENGQVPKKDVVEDLEDILRVEEKELLDAAGYLRDGRAMREVKASLFARLRLEHLQRLAEIAEQLLANELDTVRESEPSSIQGDTGSADWSKYKYWTGYTVKRGVADDKALSQMLSDNWDSLSRSCTKTELNCFMYHVNAEFDDVAKDRLVNPQALYRHLRGFKYLRINDPYEFIVRVRKSAGSLGFKGTCPICREWEP